MLLHSVAPTCRSDQFQRFAALFSAPCTTMIRFGHPGGTADWHWSFWHILRADAAMPDCHHDPSCLPDYTPDHHLKKTPDRAGRPVPHRTRNIEKATAGDPRPSLALVELPLTAQLNPGQHSTRTQMTSNVKSSSMDLGGLINFRHAPHSTNDLATNHGLWLRLCSAYFSIGQGDPHPCGLGPPRK
jgi:hypothetical protein